jgi:hypothetical protein
MADVGSVEGAAVVEDPVVLVVDECWRGCGELEDVREGFPYKRVQIECHGNYIDAR